MKEKALPLTDKTIESIIKTAQAFIGRSRIALEREYPKSRRKNPESSTYLLKFTHVTLVWIPNIFDICDVCLIQFENQVDINTCIALCNEKMEVIKPNLWLDDDTMIQFYIENSKQHNFLVGWKFPHMLR